MSTIIKKPFKNWNGADWDKVYCETSEDQLKEAVQNLALSGYRKLPSGLIIQWGSNQTNTEGGGYGLFIITLPISFPTARVGNFFSLNTPDDSEWVLAHPILINTGSNLGMIRVVANIAKTNKNITLNWMVLGY